MLGNSLTFVRVHTHTQQVTRLDRHLKGSSQTPVQRYIDAARTRLMLENAICTQHFANSAIPDKSICVFL